MQEKFVILNPDGTYVSDGPESVKSLSTAKVFTDTKNLIGMILEIKETEKLVMSISAGCVVFINRFNGEYVYISNDDGYKTTNNFQEALVFDDGVTTPDNCIRVRVSKTTTRTIKGVFKRC